MSFDYKIVALGNCTGSTMSLGSETQARLLRAGLSWCKTSGPRCCPAAAATPLPRVCSSVFACLQQHLQVCCLSNFCFEKLGCSEHFSINVVKCDGLFFSKFAFAIILDNPFKFPFSLLQIIKYPPVGLPGSFVTLSFTLTSLVQMVFQIII